MMGNCKKCMGSTKLILGALLLLNAFVWPRWNDLTGWIAWVAVLMTIGGFLMLVMPNKCKGCNASCAPAPVVKKTAKKKATRKRR
ncbi:hypothetical protein HOI26_05840 [Candidatus Woesearchaeota archaeon]|jgi:hypothetical protein|nr:hypothetical protein [Candidatus Woesearchaeota archaeon]MBT5740589.1 hypothetical protein [Candidatus Woesearchaeota archaeon]